MGAPKYLTGDKAGIDEFVDSFDVCCFTILEWSSHRLTSILVFPVRLRWYDLELKIAQTRLSLREG